MSQCASGKHRVYHRARSGCRVTRGGVPEFSRPVVDHSFTRPRLGSSQPDEAEPRASYPQPREVPYLPRERVHARLPTPLSSPDSGETSVLTALRRTRGGARRLLGARVGTSPEVHPGSAQGPRGDEPGGGQDGRQRCGTAAFAMQGTQRTAALPIRSTARVPVGLREPARPRCACHPRQCPPRERRAQARTQRIPGTPRPTLPWLPVCR